MSVTYLTSFIVSLVIKYGIATATTTGERVVVLDTTKADSLDWVSYKHSRQSRGWREASYLDDERRSVLRIHTVCNVATSPVDNWLRTPYIRLYDVDDDDDDDEEHRANRTTILVYIDVEFTMRQCDTRRQQNETKAAQLPQCKESFKLYYYEAETDLANNYRPTWDSNTYRLVDVIAADQLLSVTDVDDDGGSKMVNFERRTLSTDRRGFYLTFRDEGSCMTLLTVTVYYFQCPSVVTSLTVFPRTFTGDKVSSVVSVRGRCVRKARVTYPYLQPTFLCTANGSWYYYSGSCLCERGFQPNSNLSQCEDCPVGYYKSSLSNNRCVRCPGNSNAISTGSSSCSCLSGYYRGETEDVTVACTRPPSEPRDLQLQNVSRSEVVVRWREPADKGERSDVVYSIQCVVCDKPVTFLPSQHFINATSATVLHVEPGRFYVISVSSHNGVSAFANNQQQRTAKLSFTTAYSRVSRPRIVSLGCDHVTLMWDAVPVADVIYDVVYWSTSDSDELALVKSVKNAANITQLNTASAYCFKVRAKAGLTWTEFSDVVCATTVNSPCSRHGVRSQLLVSDVMLSTLIGVLVIGVLVCLIVVSTIFIHRCIVRHRRLRATQTFIDSRL